MKKILIALLAGVAMIALANCKSIDTGSMGGKTVVVATEQGLFVSVKNCIEALNAEGVTDLGQANGAPTQGIYSLSSLSGQCQASGTK